MSDEKLPDLAKIAETVSLVEKLRAPDRDRLKSVVAGMLVDKAREIVDYCIELAHSAGPKDGNKVLMASKLLDKIAPTLRSPTVETEGGNVNILIQGVERGPKKEIEQ